ncbi:MAG: GntR family transcriptional regulator [Nakamurella sp.]
MSVGVVIDPAAAVPVYEQVRSQIAGAIASGQLEGGERLPTARALASDLGIAVNTVIRAYGELSREGVISSRRRFGTVVTADTDSAAPADVQAAAVRLVMRAAAAGLTADQIVDLVRSVATRTVAANPVSTKSSR